MLCFLFFCELFKNKIQPIQRNATFLTKAILPGKIIMQQNSNELDERRKFNILTNNSFYLLQEFVN